MNREKNEGTDDNITNKHGGMNSRGADVQLFQESMMPYLLTNRTAQKLAKDTKILGMIRGIRFDHLYSDIPMS
ncbi:hypothetical protein TNCV_2932301 [Trichonephila clavipes]|nr:hypothetical protein TNCV_2932301 [Trichonephila clavipes]